MQSAIFSLSLRICVNVSHKLSIDDMCTSVVCVIYDALPDDCCKDNKSISNSIETSKTASSMFDNVLSIVFVQGLFIRERMGKCHALHLIVFPAFF